MYLQHSLTRGTTVLLLAYADEALQLAADCQVAHTRRYVQANVRQPRPAAEVLPEQVAAFHSPRPRFGGLVSRV